MYEVAIIFVNGSKVEFHAEEFDIDLKPSKLEEYSSGQAYQLVQKFTYKDRNGEDAPIYLRPGEVAGIIVAADKQSMGTYGLTTR